VKPLFAYGTLRDDAWRAALLGAHYPARPATLRGYLRIANASGYLSLRATGDDDDRAAGVLIDLDDIGWRIADAWEDAAIAYPSEGASMPADTLAPKPVAEAVLYCRVDVVAEAPDGPVAATAYVCADDAGEPAPAGRLALRADDEVEAAIAAFAPHARALRANGAAR
jgi:hypothetical protein